MEELQRRLRLFYKGLIQAAVALHHFGNGNIRGARKVYRSSRGYLEPYRPAARRARPGKVPGRVRRLLCRGRGQHGGVSADRDRSGADSGDSPRPARRVAAGRRVEASISDESCRKPATFHFARTTFSGQARLFPLPNLVMYPHVMQPLHIFEPRYREMLEDDAGDDRLIAMAMLAPGWETDYESRPPSCASTPAWATWRRIRSCPTAATTCC